MGRVKRTAPCTLRSDNCHIELFVYVLFYYHLWYMVLANFYAVFMQCSCNDLIHAIT